MEKSDLEIWGHVTIKDKDTGEVLVDQSNAINFEVLSLAIVESMISGTLNASESVGTGFIYAMAFGNGGTTVSDTGVIIYNPPNVVGTSAALYNQVYSKVINNNFSADIDPTNNNLTYSHVPGKAYTDITVACVLDYGEPSGQTAFDNSNSLATQYALDEMGLVTSSGQLLTHVVFSPTLKSANRRMSISYTVRISTLSSLSA